MGEIPLRAKSRILGLFALSGLSLGMLTGVTAESGESVAGSVTMANTDCAVVVLESHGDLSVEAWGGEISRSDRSESLTSEIDGNTFVVAVNIHGQSSASDDQCYLALDTDGLYHTDHDDTHSSGTTHIGRSNFDLPNPGMVIEGTSDFEITLVSVPDTLQIGTYTGTLEFTISNDEQAD